MRSNMKFVLINLQLLNANRCKAGKTTVRNWLWLWDLSFASFVQFVADEKQQIEIIQ